MSEPFSKITFLLSISYLLVISIFLVLHRAWFSPDQFFAAALLLTLFIGRFKQFIRDWSVPTVLFLSYEYLRGLTPKLSIQAHIYPMINFDKAVFGTVPTNGLQSIFFQGQLSWYDHLAVILYMSHFVVTLLVCFIFWVISKQYFRQFCLALLLLSYAAFITYVIFPSQPPWMASEQGIIPKVEKIMDQVFASLPKPVDLPSVYKFVGANLVAAVPSLHAAYPFLIFLFFWKRFGRWALIFMPYLLAVWITIVYLGEHYVFDIVIALPYAFLSFVLVTKFKVILKYVLQTH